MLLREYFTNNTRWLHTDEALVEALKFVREPQRVEAELVQNRGMQIMDVHAILGDVETEVIAFADGNAGLDAAAGHPDRKGSGVMVAA